MAAQNKNNFRNDRAGRKGEGVLVAVKTTYHTDRSGTLPSFEAVVVRIKMLTMFIIVIARYKPPRVLDFAPLLHDFLDSLIIL